MVNTYKSNRIRKNKKADRHSLYAGVAKSEITIHEDGILISDPLYTKILILDDTKTKIVIISMDTTCIGGREISQGILDDVGEDFLPNLRKKIENKFKIPFTNILVNASHTHPPGRLLCSDSEQVKKVFAAVSKALKNMTEVMVGSGIGYEEKITINRTLRLKNGRHWSIRHTNPCPPDNEVESIGPIDPEIGVLRIDRLDGTPLAVVYNFACHPLFANASGKISANFPAYASKVIEETLGHETMALFLQGAAGNIIDVGFKDFAKPRDIEALGTMLGLSTLKAYRKIKTKTVALNIISKIVELPRRTDIPQQILLLQNGTKKLLKSLQGTTLNFKSFLPLFLKYTLSPDFPLDYSYKYLQAEKIGSPEINDMDAVNKCNIKKYLKNIKAMEKLSRIQDNIATLKKHMKINAESSSTAIKTELMGVKIGDFILITSPAEILVETGLNIKKSSKYSHTFISAYTNGYIHYGCPVDYYSKGGYEVSECLLAPEWQNIFETKSQEVINNL